jgi:hypothetical protein
MALLFSEAFETTTLIQEFFPVDVRPANYNAAADAPRTGNHIRIGTAANQPEQFLGFRFNTALGPQSNKKLFFGFAARSFRTAAGARDGTFTERLPFFELVDETGTAVLRYAFDKELSSDPNSNVFKLSLLQDTTVLARYPLPDLQTDFSNSGPLIMKHRLPNTTAFPNWVYFEWEVDLTQATPTIRFFMNGYPLTDALTDSDVPVSVVVPFTTLGGVNIYGNTTSANFNGYGDDAYGPGLQVDDFYISDDQQETVHYPETALLSRLGPVKVYTTTFFPTNGIATNWTNFGGSSASDSLGIEDGDAKHVASNTLNAQLATLIDGPGGLTSFERVAGVQMIYSARSAGALDTALMPTLQAGSGTPVEYYAGAAPTVFPGGSATYTTKIVTLQTDPIRVANGDESVAFSPTTISTSGTFNTETRRIGLRLDAVPSTP